MSSTRPRRRLPGIALACAALTLAVFGVRHSVAQVFVVPVASLEPEIPAGSRILVSKLAERFGPGDIVAFHDPATGQTHLGRFESRDATGTLTLSRNGAGPVRVHHDELVGRVVLVTR